MLHIVLDPCCGININRHRSPIWNNMTQLYEWKFNRSIVNKIKMFFLKKNIPIHILTNTKQSEYLSDKIRKINSLVEKYGKYNVLVISIQVNRGKKSGWECLYHEKNELSKEYAEVFSKTYKSSKIPFPNNGIRHYNMSIMRLAKCPSIVTNNLYIDTKKDCMYLLTSKGEKAIKDLHIDAIYNSIEFYKNNIKEWENLQQKSQAKVDSLDLKEKEQLSQ